MFFYFECSHSALGLPLSIAEALLLMQYCFVSEKTPGKKATQTLQPVLSSSFKCGQPHRHMAATPNELTDKTPGGL